jgi:hypothetical protein
MFRNFVSLATLSLVLVLAAQAQGSTLLSYWPMNDGLSNPTATTVQNLGTLGSAYNATFGVAYANRAGSVLTPPGLALGTTSSGNLIGEPYAAGGYSSTYTAHGGATYTLPQWTTSGPFAYGLTFSGANTAISGTPSNNWGMNFVYVPGGGATNAGQGGGGISGACAASTGVNSSLAISMWVQWNASQIEATHTGSGGASNAIVTATYGQPICWNAASSFSDLEFGLNGPNASSAQLASNTTNGSALTTVGTATNLTGWSNVVIAGSYNSSWSVYLNGSLAGHLPVGALGTMTAQQQMLTLGGDWAYSWPTAYNNPTGTGQLAGYVGGNPANSPWPNNGAGPSSGNSSMYLGPFNGSMADVGFFGNGTGAGLTVGEAESIYNTPAVSGLRSYNLGDMDQLFALYEGGSGTKTIGSLTWQYVSALPGTAAGQAGTSGGYYYVNLSGTTGGAGVEALLVPEPSTLLLLAGGLTGLMAYAWRRRRRC